MLNRNHYQLLVSGAILIICGILRILQSDSTYADSVDYFQPIAHISGDAQTLDIQDDFAYVGFESTFKIIDISILAEPKVVAHFDVNYEITDIAVHKEFAYITEQHGLYVINIADPEEPYLARFYPYSYATSAQIERGHLYIYHRQGVHIYSLQSAPLLVEEGFFATVSWPDYMAVYDDVVAIRGYFDPDEDGLSTRTIYIIDAHDLSNLTVTDYREDRGRNATPANSDTNDANQWYRYSSYMYFGNNYVITTEKYGCPRGCYITVDFEQLDPDTLTLSRLGYYWIPAADLWWVGRANTYGNLAIIGLDYAVQAKPLDVMPSSSFSSHLEVLDSDRNIRYAVESMFVGNHIFFVGELGFDIVESLPTSRLRLPMVVSK